MTKRLKMTSTQCLLTRVEEPYPFKETRGSIMRTLGFLTLVAIGATLMQITARAQAQAEPKPLPPLKIVLVGDSTVASGGGWGQEFAALLKPQAQCVNVASPGRSSKSFRDEGRWEKALEQKPDYVFIQFGHNDMPGKGPERETDPQTTYPENLKRYVQEARAIGAKPILVTPLTRRFWTPDGHIKSDLITYAQAVIQVAKDNHVPLVDLHARSIEQFNTIGRAAARQYDRHHDDPTKPDATHLSDFGAQATALLVAHEVQNVEPELGIYLNLPLQPHK
jgi:lysophospholipase L1-like esterase